MKISYRDAIRKAQFDAMEADSSVFVYGIGINDHIGVFGTTLGLAERFPGRSIETPIAEAAMTGFGVGAAIGGLRPVHIHIRADFAFLALDQLVNVASSYSFSVGGKRKLPLVVRMVVGRGWGQGWQHSKSLQGLFAGIPGLRVLAPVTANNAYWFLRDAIAGEEPTVIIEHRWLYWGEDDIEVPSRVQRKRKGCDGTIVATSWQVVEALHAADILSRLHYLEMEVIAVTQLNPFIAGEFIADSVRRTQRLFVVDNDWAACGMASEIVASVMELPGVGCLRAPPQRISWPMEHIPTARRLENAFYPNAETIVRRVEKVIGIEPCDLSHEDFYSHEKHFTGPF